MQISSGFLRGLSLKVPKGHQTRPSSERLRQAIFNVLRHFRWNPPDSEENHTILDQAVVADVFAGTGAWGFEALSNGAKEVWFLESNALASKSIQENKKAVFNSY